MINKKVLIMASYPIEGEALHGGQKRVRAMVDFYRRQFTEVRFVAVFHEKFFDSYGPDDISIQDPTVIKSIEKSVNASDLLSGEAIYADATVKRRLTGLLQEYEPDIIQMEQIYSFAGLEPLLKEIDFRPEVLILSSQDDETSLKKGIFSGINMPNKKKDHLLQKIYELEKRASRAADLVLAVNENNAQVHRRLGAKKCLVVSNGIDKIKPTPAALEHWQKFKQDQGLEKLVTFVGSAHPPNLFGFEEMVGRDLGFLPDGAALMLAGGISHYIQGVYGDEKPWAKRFWAKAWSLGKLSDDNLAGLIEQSDVIILPIVKGVGSNLKTAEAILADKKVVATNLAFKTFEAYIDLPNIHFADDRTAFKAAINEALATERIKRTKRQAALARKVQWQYCFEPLAAELESMFESPAQGLRQRLRKLLK